LKRKKLTIFWQPAKKHGGKKGGSRLVLILRLFDPKRKKKEGEERQRGRAQGRHPCVDPVRPTATREKGKRD